MVLKLYGIGASTCAQRVAVVLHEKKIPYKYVMVDIAKGEHKSAEYMAKQPFGQLPCIEDDDGTIVYESRAICRYLDARYPEYSPRLSVSPLDPVEYGHFEQGCSNEATNFDPFASAAALHLIIWPQFGMEVDPEYARKKLKTLELKLDVYEGILSKQKYIAGDKLTLADLFHLPYGAMLPACGFTALEDGSRPNVARWWKDVSTRPSWLAVKDGNLLPAIEK